VVHELASDPGRSHAEHLPGDLITVLDAAQVALDAVDVFAVATGPGSFTGLRVGIATMQGLAFATGKPLIGVSALDALAEIVRSDSGSHALVATWIDAWRGEVYAALYHDEREMEPPTVEHPQAILQRLARHVSQADREGLPRRVRFAGDGAASFADLIRGTLGSGAVIADPVMPLLAGAIARLAGEAARAGVHTAPDAIRPLYVRRTDAELARDARVDR
jgi:tRNA threonylcarbamoyladenosine biosynthesis protein TsaB